MKSCLKTNMLLIATTASVVAGVAVGMLCRQLNPSPDTILLVGFPGEIFMRMLQMITLPLIAASLITGHTSDIYICIGLSILGGIFTSGETVATM